MTPTEIQSLIRRRAVEAGIDPTHAITMASIETGGTFDPKAVNKAGTHKGLFQFGSGEWKTYGGGKDIFDPNAQLDAYFKYQPRIQATMRSALGRDPTPQELYLGWQQGAGGASSLLKGANKPVGQLTTIGNVTANGGTPDMTGAQFAALWNNKYNAHQRQILGRKAPWTGEGDTQESQWIGGPPNVAEAGTAVAAAPEDYRDMVGYGGSPPGKPAQQPWTGEGDTQESQWIGGSPPGKPAQQPAAKPFDFGGLLGAGMRQVAAGEPKAASPPPWMQQAMNAPGQAHRPQMQPGGLLAAIFPDQQRRRLMFGGLLGDE